jgi:hypothetical protein
VSLRGQLDLKTGIAVVGVLLTPAGGCVGHTWARYTAAEDFRREQLDHRRLLEEHGKQLAEVALLPGRVQRIEKAAEGYQEAQRAQAAALQEILHLLRGGTRRASGKAP